MSVWRHEPPPEPDPADLSPLAHALAVVVLFGGFSLVGVLLTLLFIQILYPAAGR
jgi:hypothetical protein